MLDLVSAVVGYTKCNVVTVISAQEYKFGNLLNVYTLLTAVHKSTSIAQIPRGSSCLDTSSSSPCVLPVSSLSNSTARHDERVVSRSDMTSQEEFRLMSVIGVHDYTCCLMCQVCCPDCLDLPKVILFSLFQCVHIVLQLGLMNVY